MDNTDFVEEELNSNLKKCKYCKSDIDADAKICLVCKKKQKSSAGKVVIAVVIVCVVAFLALFAGMVSNRRTYIMADNIGKEVTASDTYFDRYDVTRGDGGYFVTVYLADAYGTDSYMRHLVEGHSSGDAIDASDLTNWEYYYDGEETTYSQFMLNVAMDIYKDEYQKALDVYSEEYKNIMDTYTDYLDDYMDMFN